jgi:hypothetical protein
MATTKQEPTPAMGPVTTSIGVGVVEVFTVECPALNAVGQAQSIHNAMVNQSVGQMTNVGRKVNPWDLLHDTYESAVDAARQLVARHPELTVKVEKKFISQDAYDAVRDRERWL